MNATQSGYSLDDLPSLEAARRMWHAGDWDAAIQAYQEVLADHPANVRVLLECARALGQRYRTEEAEVLIATAADLAGHDPQVEPYIAQSYGRIYRSELAMQRLEQCWSRGTLPLPMLAELAVLYEQSGNLDAAREAIDEVVHQTTHEEPLLVLARICRARGELRQASEILQRLIRAGTTPALTIRAWYVCAQLRDGEGDYPGAIQALETAKHLQQAMPQVPRLAVRSKAINASALALHRQLTPECVDAWRQKQLQFAPDDRVGTIAHLLSFPRSGTTLLEQCLARHPSVMDSPERSVFVREIFPVMCRATGHPAMTLPSLIEIDEAVLDTLRKRYIDFMEAAAGEAVAGRVHVDKNPNHTSLLAPLLRLFPDAKVLFALRDPRDVIVSNYFQFFPMTEYSVNFLDWESAACLYRHEMSLWVETRHCLTGQYLEIRYEDAVNDLEAVSQRCWSFLGVDSSLRPVEYSQHVRGKFVSSPSYAAVRKPVYRTALGRWRHYARWLQQHCQEISPFLEEFGYDI